MWAFLLFVMVVGGDWEIYEVQHPSYTNQAVCVKDIANVVARVHRMTEVIWVTHSVCYPKDEKGVSYGTDGADFQ